MVNNRRIYTKLLLLIITLVVLASTQSLAVSVLKVTGLRLQDVDSTEIKISWNKLSDVTGYEVHVKKENGLYENLGKVSKPSVKISGLTAGTTYYVKVRAFKTVNGRTTYANEFSNEIKATTKGANTDNTTIISKVTNLKLDNVTETTAKVSWNKLSDVTGYEVHVKRENGSYKNLGKVSNANVTINNLEKGTTYYVKVRAFKTVNGRTTYANKFSNEIKVTTKNANTDNTTTVSKVTNLKLDNVTETTAKVSWNKLSDVTGYEVHVKRENGSYKNLGKVSNANVTINNLEKGTTYYVKVRAFKTVNGKTTYSNEFSNEIKVTTKSNSNTTTIEQVTNLKSNNVTKVSADLKWNEVSNVDGYEIYSRTSGKGYSSVGTTSSTYATLRDLTAGTTYYVKVRAFKTVNGKTTYGKFSSEIIITTIKENDTPDINVTLGKISNLKADVATTQASLTWNTLANVDGYEIYINNQGKGYQLLGKTSKDNAKIIGLVAGKKYSVKVRAYKIVNGKETYGEFSDEITFTTQSEETLGTVANLNVTVSSNEAKLTWEKVSTATGYEIYIKLPGRGYISLGTVGDKDNVRIVNFTKGSNYSVKVRAYKRVNGKTIYGKFSEDVTFTAE